VEPIRHFLLEPLQDLSSSVPMPWRVAIVLGPPLLLALLLVPRLLRLLLELLSVAIGGLGRGYAWVEYQLVRLLRRLGQQPWSLVGTLDDGVERVVLRTSRATRDTARSPLLRKVVRTTLFVLAALPLLCWYAAPKIEPGTGLRTSVAHGVIWTSSFDAWVRTGTWPDPHKKPRPKPKAKPKAKARTDRSAAP
jgi:hypothetical protein